MFPEQRVVRRANHLRLLLCSMPVHKQHSACIWPIRHFINFTTINDRSTQLEMIVSQVQELLITLLLTVIL